MLDPTAVTLETLGPLRVRRVGPPRHPAGGAAAPGVAPNVVLMHGFGAPGDDLVALAGAIRAPAETVFYFPEAPLSLGDFVPMAGFDSRAWWMIDIARLERGMASGNVLDMSKDVPVGLAEAHAKMNETLDAIEARDAKEGGKRPLVLGGFSQGAMLATDLALRSSRPLAALVLLSGTLLAEHEWIPAMRARAGLPVLMSHGTEDPILPYVLAERLRDAFVAAGAKVTFESFDGGHGIPPSVLAAFGRLL